MNSFQLLTMWILGIAVGAGCVWLLMRNVNRRPLNSAGLDGALEMVDGGPAVVPAYRINGPFVEICVTDGCSLSDLRALFESIRNDPALPTEALLLFDGRRRTERLTDDDVRARLTTFLEILRPRIAPMYAVVVSAAIALASQAAQQYAAAAGVRVELFRDFERAREWLSTGGQASERS